MAGINPKLGRLVFLAVLLLMSQHVSAVPLRTTANVAMRRCPSTGTPVIVTVPRGATIDARCRVRGETISGDPWWIYASYGGFLGWISDYYVGCGGAPCSLPSC